MNARNRSNALLRLSVRSADSRIELTAASLLRRCVNRAGDASVPLPVPIDEWIERPLGYRFSIAGAGELGPGVLGMARPTENEILVSDTLLENEGRYRFTCAHELGHMVLHGEAAARFEDTQLPSGDGADAVEREADRFASSVLMPLAELAGAFESVRREKGLDPNVYERLRGEDAITVWLWRRCFLPGLCGVFGVSRAAMAYRCREVRLPGKRRLVRPSLVPLLVAPKRAVVDLGLDRIAIEGGMPVLRGD